MSAHELVQRIRGACCRPWGPELNLQDPRDERKELTFTSCPLTPTYMCMCTCTYMNTNMHTHTNYKEYHFPKLHVKCFTQPKLTYPPLLNRTSHTHSVSNKRHGKDNWCSAICSQWSWRILDVDQAEKMSLSLCETDQPLNRYGKAFCLSPTLPILIWGQKFESSWVSTTRECSFLRPVGLSSLSSDRGSCFLCLGSSGSS